MVKLCISKCACLCVMVFALLGKLRKESRGEKERSGDPKGVSSHHRWSDLCERCESCVRRVRFYLYVLLSLIRVVCD